METLFTWLNPARRKKIYDVAAALLGLFTVVLPILVSNGLVENSLATQLVNVGTGILGVLAVLLARKNVPSPTE